MQYPVVICNTLHHHGIPCKSMQYHAIPSNAMQYHAIPCNTMQYHAIPCNIMHAYYLLTERTTALWAVYGHFYHLGSSARANIILPVKSYFQTSCDYFLHFSRPWSS